jgi:hypothetical protein
MEPTALLHLNDNRPTLDDSKRTLIAWLHQFKDLVTTPVLDWFHDNMHPESLMIRHVLYQYSCLSEKQLMRETKATLIEKINNVYEVLDKLDTTEDIELRLNERFPFLNIIGPVDTRNVITTREGWLERAAEIMYPWIIGAAEAERDHREIQLADGARIQQYELKHPPSGFDVAVAPIEKAQKGCVGICRMPSFHGGRARIQIAPRLSGKEGSWDDETYIVHVLLHEMVHAVTEGHGHRGAFRAIMKRLNSAGKMTATYPGDVQEHAIKTRVLIHLPRYADIHTPFSVPKRGQRGVGSRMVKVWCPNELCGIIMRASGKVCEQIHMQPCPACEEAPLHVEGWQ